jgi:cell filamentation protein
VNYDSANDPYLDAQTGVLRNKLGITTTAKLDDAEAIVTTAAIVSLSEQPVIGDFDLTHLQALHKRLFSPIYDWAGELRTVIIGKGETQFANPEFLQQAGDELFAQLHSENLLLDLPEDEYIARFAHYYSEVNILHPFREGNGRTQRAFFTLLATESGRDVAWELMDPRENLIASVAAYTGNESRLVAMLSKIIRQKL